MKLVLVKVTHGEDAAFEEYAINFVELLQKFVMFVHQINYGDANLMYGNALNMLIA